MIYHVIIHKRAVRYLNSLTGHQRDRIKKSLKDLENGINEKTGVKPMTGIWKGYYRMRVGDIRIIFWIDNTLMTVYVDHIGTRGDVYKKK